MTTKLANLLTAHRARLLAADRPGVDVSHHLQQIFADVANAAQDGLHRCTIAVDFSQVPARDRVPTASAYCYCAYLLRDLGYKCKTSSCSKGLELSIDWSSDQECYLRYVEELIAVRSFLSGKGQGQQGGSTRSAVSIN